MCFPTSILTCEYSSLNVKICHCEVQLGLYLTVPKYCLAVAIFGCGESSVFQKKEREILNFARYILHLKRYIVMAACFSFTPPWVWQKVFQRGLSYLILKIKEFYLTSASIQNTNLHITNTWQWSAANLLPASLTQPQQAHSVTLTDVHFSCCCSLNHSSIIRQLM